MRGASKREYATGLRFRHFCADRANFRGIFTLAPRKGAAFRSTAQPLRSSSISLSRPLGRDWIHASLKPS
jgi:hypothetical protein